MRIARLLAVLALVTSAGCSRGWPDPPPVDAAAYGKAHDELMQQQRETATYALSLVGAWPLAEGDTSFGSAADEPIALPASVAPHVGVLRRSGADVVVLPAPGVTLTREDGAAVKTGESVEQGAPLQLGSVHLEVYTAGSDIFASAWDTASPALKDMKVEAYPVDSRWRVAARFDAFEKPRPVKIVTTRGTVHDAHAVGQLVFRVNGEESRLTALAEPGDGEFFVMFKDATNGKTTFSGYRMLSPKKVANGGWTVLDFNLAENPPCAYSKFTMCPLPPKENRLALAVEAGVKRDPLGRGFSE